ncbi:MAG TPA: DsrE family protein [Aggregatilineales bacterium]|nr:DsrE family protein [Aggregatilineales bacterium]
MGHVMIHNTHGNDDVERASLTFVVANTALNSNQRATVLLTIEGVWIATQGYADGLQANGFAPLSDLMHQFVANGGELWVCGACAKPRNITEEHLIDGAQIIGAATAVEALVNGAQTLSF